jgi:ribosomal protein L16/L10AE
MVIETLSLLAVGTLAVYTPYEATAREAFRLAGAKLSVSTMFVKRQVR